MAEYQPEIERENDEYLFASPWDDSDMVLVVEDQELHVHKWILKSQSPVFRAMFDGHFQEAGQDKITLNEKNFESMVQFLKVLYPSSMFGGARVDLDDESLLSVLALADEYQCVNLIKQYVNDAKITPEIVVKMLPYVVKYHQTALPKLYDVMKWAIPTSKLEWSVLPKLESTEASNVMLLTKCHYLESNLVDMQNSMVRLIREFLLAAQRRSCLTGGMRECNHMLKVEEIDATKKCSSCEQKYKDHFIPPFDCCRNKHAFKNKLLKLLQTGDDIANTITPREQMLEQLYLESCLNE